MTPPGQQLLLQVATVGTGQVDALVGSTLGALLAGAARPAILDTLRAYLDQGANMNATATGSSLPGTRSRTGWSSSPR